MEVGRQGGHVSDCRKHLVWALDARLTVHAGGTPLHPLPLPCLACCRPLPAPCATPAAHLQRLGQRGGQRLAVLHQALVEVAAVGVEGAQLLRHGCRNLGVRVAWGRFGEAHSRAHEANLKLTPIPGRLAALPA
jgi:hypothetical protein